MAGELGAPEAGVGFLDEVVEIGEGGEACMQEVAELGFVPADFLVEPVGLGGALFREPKRRQG